MRRNSDHLPATRPTGFLAALRNLEQAILFVSCKLNRIQFSAPWRTGRPSC
jgi:hypothetical protein